MIIALRASPAATHFVSALEGMPEGDLRIVDDDEGDSWLPTAPPDETDGVLAEILRTVRGMPGGRRVAPREGAHAIQRPAPGPRLRGGLAPCALRRVRDFVEAHLAEKISLGQLAALAGISECHFSRAFKQSMGMPPRRYLMNRRIEAALPMIEGSDRPLAEISTEVGFVDQSHFTRVFAALTGETPSAFRYRHR